VVRILRKTQTEGMTAVLSELVRQHRHRRGDSVSGKPFDPGTPVSFGEVGHGPSS
jgi:hypothetical protein